MLKLYISSFFLTIFIKLSETTSNSDFYQFVARDIDSGKDVSMNQFRGKILLVVNVASECGFTDTHYRELVDLQRSYDQKKFRVLAFPCNQFGKQEPKKNKFISKFAKTNYNANFDMFEKIKTTGKQAHPIYKWLKEQTNGYEPTWNFNKYLLNHKGRVVRYGSAAISPLEMENDIRRLLAYENLNGGVSYYEDGEHNEL